MPTSFEHDPHHFPELWRSAYQLLEQSVVPYQLRTWIQPLHFHGSEPTESGHRVHLSAVNSFSAQWVRDNLLQRIEDAFTQVHGAPCQVVISTENHPQSTMEDDFNPPVESRRPAVPQLTPRTPEPQNKPQPPRIEAIPSSLRRHEPAVDPRYTFSNFVVGSSNQFAKGSALAVAERPGALYNPLFLYGPPGLGKTHLMHAIGNHVLSLNPKARVAYLSAETFVNELIESLRGSMPAFRAKYRDSYDLLLIDDIQFIAGKGATEQEFFHTFNAFHTSKRQIVMCSDRSPKDIDGLEDRLRTRFEWGLVTDIQPPEIETRIAILKTKAERDDIYLPDDVAVFLATHIKSDVRALEGMLIHLQAQSSLTGAEISIDMARTLLKQSAAEEGNHYTVENIQHAAAKFFHLKPSDLKSASRAQSIALPRQIAIYLIRKYTGMGYKDLAQIFGGKDHTTMIHAVKKIEQGIQSNSSLREQVEGVQNLL